MVVLLTRIGVAKEADRSRIPPPQLQEGLTLKRCDALEKGAAQPAFKNDLPCVEASVSLLHISGPHTLRFLYYDPDVNLYATTKPDWTFGPPADRKEYHRTARITHRLMVKSEEAAFHLGDWKVAVWLDELHLAETRFRLEPQPLPLEQNLAEAKALYREGSFERAIDRLNTVVNSVHHKGLIAEAAWWLALSQQALGREADAEASLMRLLQAEPTFGVTPAAAREAGGEGVRARLEELRKRELLDLYVKSVHVPKAELTPPEAAPVLGRRWPLWKKLLIYGGIPAAAAATTFVLASGGESIAGPPTVVMEVDPSAARDGTYGLICAGAIPLRVSISGGEPPFEALFTVAKQPQASAAVEVAGITESLSSADVVILKRSIPNSGQLMVRTPPITMPGAFNIAELRFAVVVKDSRAKVSFDSVSPGMQMQPSLLQDERVVRQLFGGGVVKGCVQ
jgi:hypothetical protein